jgi:tetratricopeptide (TPR) repeat protein
MDKVSNKISEKTSKKKEKREDALAKFKAHKKAYDAQVRKLPAIPKKETKEFLWKIRRLNEKGLPVEALIRAIPYLGLDPFQLKSITNDFHTDQSKEALLLEACESYRILEAKNLPLQTSKPEYPHVWRCIAELSWNILDKINSYSYRALYLFLTSSYKLSDKEYLKKALTVANDYLDRFPQEFTIRLWTGHVHLKLRHFEDAAIEYAKAEQKLEKNDNYYFLPRGNEVISLKERIRDKLLWMLHCFEDECTNKAGQITNYRRYSDCLSIANTLQKYLGFELSTLKEVELLIRTNQYHEAKDILDFLLEQNPKLHSAMAALAQTHLENGDYRRALECIKKAEYHDQKNPRYRDIEDAIIREGLYALHPDM